MIVTHVSTGDTEVRVRVMRWTPGARYPEQLRAFSIPLDSGRPTGRSALRLAAVGLLQWLDALDEAERSAHTE